MRPLILGELEKGASLALVSDAGTPLISDPGFKLVRELRQGGHSVIPIPGASALTAALSAAGLPTDLFTFAGFLPPKSTARKTRLEAFHGLDTTLALYETGNRLADVLTDIIEVYGDVPIVMARELTKLFETFVSSPASELITSVEENGPPKGEIVLLVSLHGAKAAATSEEDIEQFLLSRIDDLGVKTAANEAAKAFDRPKRDMYAFANRLKDSRGDG